MGMGGFHMHSRVGLDTKYMDKEFMDIVAGCVQRAEDEKMLACLYDEDRWPSGAAGGMVVKDHPEYKLQHLLLTPQPYGNMNILLAPDLFVANKDSDSSNDQTVQAIKAFNLIIASSKDPSALVKSALGLLQTQITKILRLETEMEPGKPLMSYGLDSLSAVELRGWVRQKTGAELSTLDITNASSLIALSEKLVSKLPAEVAQ